MLIGQSRYMLERRSRSGVSYDAAGGYGRAGCGIDCVCVGRDSGYHSLLHLR
jgi:hypothetical protein